MNDNVFNVIVVLIPVIGAIITGFLIPLIKSNIDTKTLEKITYWVKQAVLAAEVLFKVPNSGDQKRDYVINFIDSMFNSKKEVISKDQIRILLEATWKELLCDSSSTKS